ncbi:WD domain containing protein [Entamoeba histolytica KU27]|uniref:WD domain containing protein n=1 Tax=Entamoeba histolytica KU27 TaxID=885311 RepID=M2S2Z7_ENTHI|nr:WD domain containing protein [Entamoeba histolytica KU27]
MRRAQFTLFKAPHEKRDNELEGKYWDDFTPVSSYTYPSPKCIRFSPSQKQTFAVCSGMNVFVHSSTESQPKVITRHKDFVYTCEYRNDGALISTGCADGKVRVFDSTNKTLLRTLSGHSAAVRTVCWGKEMLYSSGDDMVVKAWDFTTKSVIGSYANHTDSVRSIVQCPTNPFLIASGSYDHTVVLYDTRSKNSINVFKHKNPVEDIVFHPVGTLIAVANGQMITVWDSTTGSQISDYSYHTNLVTNILFDTDGNRLFSSSLDCSINVYETTNYSKLHNIVYPSPILSFDMNKDSTAFSVGLTNGEVILFAKQQPQQTENHASSSAKYFFQGKTQTSEEKKEPAINKTQSDISVNIRKFDYDDALDKALATKDETIIISVIREILYRNGLKIALSRRDENTLEPLMTFLINTLPSPLHTKILVEVMSQLLDLYAQDLGKSVVFDEMFFKMQKRLEKEIQLNKNMQQLLGQIDLIIGAADCARSKSD